MVLPDLTMLCPSCEHARAALRALQGKTTKWSGQVRLKRTDEIVREAELWLECDNCHSTGLVPTDAGRQVLQLFACANGQKGGGA